MIIDEIKKSNIEALKNHDSVSKSIFSVVLNKIKLEEINKRASGTELVDADVVAILMKSIKELQEEKENYIKVNNAEMSEEISKQIEILNGFLPKLMSEEEIKEEILKLEDKSVGNVMKHFKLNFAGKCDMKLVSETLKKLG